MSAMQQPTPNHQSETFGSGQTQFFECEALSADHPEIQALERACSELGKQGPAVRDALRKALEGKPPAEARRQIGLLLANPGSGTPRPHAAQRRLSHELARK